MEKLNREEYIDELITTTVGVEPEALFYVLERMQSIIGTDKINNHLEQIANVPDDDMISSAIGFDPALMQQLSSKLDTVIDRAVTRQKLNEKGTCTLQPERDPAFAACIDELVNGIDAQIEDYFSSKDGRLHYDAFLKFVKPIIRKKDVA